MSFTVLNRIDCRKFQFNERLFDSFLYSWQIYYWYHPTMLIFLKLSFFQLFTSLLFRLRFSYLFFAFFSLSLFFIYHRMKKKIKEKERYQYDNHSRIDLMKSRAWTDFKSTFMIIWLIFNVFFVFFLNLSFWLMAGLQNICLYCLYLLHIFLIPSTIPS